MAETRTKRVVRDYGGMAALITASASAIALFMNQSGAQDTSEKVQASLLAVMQYRLSVVEAACGVGLHPQPAAAPATVPQPVPVAAAPTPVPTTDPAPEADVDGVEGAYEGASEMVADAAPMEAPPKPPEEPRRALRRKFKAKRNLDLKDIQDYVQQSGKALSAEDL